MIANKNRAYWMGCSDADKIVGNMQTSTWRKWWMEKLGLYVSDFENKFTRAGTNYEHKILKAVSPKLTLDHQVLKPELCVRANYDGIDFSTEPPHIYECKTFNAEKGFRVSKTYWRQAQMEMWALGTDKLTIVAYPMTDAEYSNYWLQIERESILSHEIERDDEFINNELIPRITELSALLKERRCPEIWQTITENTESTEKISPKEMAQEPSRSTEPR